MNCLVEIKQNDVFTNTWAIAEALEREHKQITRIIEKYFARLSSMGPINYSPGRGKTIGRNRKIYLLNEQQAIFLMTLLDNSDKVLDFKQALAMEFVSMRRLLLEKQTKVWQQARQHSKKIRMQETDAIKALVSYAEVQGSQHANMLYMTYSKLIKKLAGYSDRDMTDVETLTLIITFERMLNSIIQTEMALNTHYKDIYIKAKGQLQQIKDMWDAPRITA